MVWRHYDAKQAGSCVITHEGAGEAAPYRFGMVATGRSRVFAGFFVEVEVFGKTHVCENDWSIREALRGLALELLSLGVTLECAGICNQWSESGLSANTGWGYLPWEDSAVNMMSPLSSDSVHEMFPNRSKSSND